MSGRWFDEDVLCLGFSECKVVPTDFDFDRIAQGRRADQRNAGTRQEAHFAEPQKRRAIFRKFSNRCGCADRQVAQLDRGSSHDLSRIDSAESGPTAHLLDQDILGRIVIKRDAIAVYSAEERSPTANFGHERRFSESQLPDPLAELGVARQFPYLPRLASGKLAKRQQCEGKTVHVGNLTSVTETRFQSHRKKKSGHLVLNPTKQNS